MSFADDLGHRNRPLVRIMLMVMAALVEATLLVRVRR